MSADPEIDAIIDELAGEDEPDHIEAYTDAQMIKKFGIGWDSDVLGYIKQQVIWGDCFVDLWVKKSDLFGAEEGDEIPILIVGTPPEQERKNHT